MHGPHDHELEHAAQGGHGGHDDGAKSGMIAQIAVITAIIATVGALFAYMGGATQANAGLYKNNAAIKKTEASNQWNFFQAKSTKQSLAEVSRDLSADNVKDKYQTKIDRYEKKKPKTNWRLKSLKKNPPIGTNNQTSKCTSITAGRRPRPCCKSRLPWRQ